MGQYLIDNNIISHYFSESFSESAMIFISEVIDNVPNISVITEIEALSWINPNKSKEKIIKKLDQNYTDLEFTLEKISEMDSFRELIVIGCVGKSIDHEIANILSLSKFAGDFKIIALDKRNIIYFLKETKIRFRKH